MDGTRCAAEPGCRWERSEAEGFCRGDGTRYQNPGQACRKLERPLDCVLESTGCSFTSDVEAPWRPRSFCSNDVAFALQALYVDAGLQLERAQLLRRLVLRIWRRRRLRL